MTDDLQACAPCLCAQEGADRAAISSCHWRSRELFVIKWMTKRCKRPNSSRSPASCEAWPGQGLTWSLHLKQETFNVAAKTSERGMHSTEATAPDGQGLKRLSATRGSGNLLSPWSMQENILVSTKPFTEGTKFYSRNLPDDGPQSPWGRTLCARPAGDRSDKEFWPEAWREKIFKTAQPL